MTVIVKDEDGFRYLYLPEPGVEPSAWDIQSEMDLEDPLHPTLYYAQAMLSALLFTHEPKSALVLGVGGGTLVRYLHHFFPKMQITGVDILQEVLDAAVKEFHTPQDKRCKLLCGDAIEFVKNCTHVYDVIFVDVYGQSGAAFVEGIYARALIKAMNSCVSKQGVVVYNLLFHQKELKAYLAPFYGQKFLTLNQMYQSNQIFVGFPHNVENPDTQTVEDQVSRWEALDPKLGYAKYWKAYKRCNRLGPSGKLLIDPLGKT